MMCRRMPDACGSDHKQEAEYIDILNQLETDEYDLLWEAIFNSISVEVSSMEEFDEHINAKERCMTTLLTQLLERRGVEQGSEFFTKLLTVIDNETMRLIRGY